MDPLLTPDLVDDPTRSPAEEPTRAATTAERRERWARHATLASVALGASGVFLVVARSVPFPHANRFDRFVMRAVGRLRRPWLTFVARIVTELGGVVGITAISSSSVLLTLTRSPRTAAQLVLGAVGGVSAELGLKQLFGRERPKILPHLQTVASKSFPSGHAMAASSFWLTLAFVGARPRRLRDHRGALLATASSIAGLVGLTRVYLGVHWPSDVLGGIALGTAWASGCEAVFDWTGARQVVEAAGSRLSVEALEPVPNASAAT